MAKITIRNLHLLIILVCINLVFASCKYYKLRSKEPSFLVAHIKNEGKYDPKRFHYVIHYNNQILELTDVVVNSEKHKLTGRLIPFEGLQLKYYEKAKSKNSSKRKLGKKHVSAIKQVHLFVDESRGNDESDKVFIHFNSISSIVISTNDKTWTPIIIAGTMLLIPIAYIIALFTLV